MRQMPDIPPPPPALPPPRHVCLRVIDLSWVAGEAVMTEATIAHAQKVVAAKGSDAWWQLPVEDLLPEELRGQAADLVKGEDTMVLCHFLPACFDGRSIPKCKAIPHLPRIQATATSNRSKNSVVFP